MKDINRDYKIFDSQIFKFEEIRSINVTNLETIFRKLPNNDDIKTPRHPRQQETLPIQINLACKLHHLSPNFVQLRSTKRPNDSLSLFPNSQNFPILPTRTY